MLASAGSLTIAQTGVGSLSASFPSLLALTDVASDLIIDFNPVLTSVTGLATIVGATITNQLNITNNATLPTVAEAGVLITALVGSGYAGVPANSGNGPG